MSALRKAFIDELKDLLDAERQLLKALPKMARAAENEQLRAAYLEHETQTAEQIRRLGNVFGAFEEPPQGKKCMGMQGLIKEAEHMIEEEEGDAALIGAAQKAEHYEIAAYGTLASWAVALGQEHVAQLLRETMEEEKETDKKLTLIAQTVVNSMDSQREEEQKAKAPSRRRARKRATAPRRSRTPSARKSNRRKTQRTTAGPRSKRLRSVAGK
jgi:ferritin-like metal-binding protein YciE